MNIVELAATDTHGLRRRVLRADTPSTDVIFDGDTLATTQHLGVETEQQLVAISSWYRRPYPAHPDTMAVQLRAMATAPNMRRRGIGSLLIAAGIERARTRGVKLVWARARDSALGFYQDNGFEVVGHGYLVAEVGQAHHDIIKMID